MRIVHLVLDGRVAGGQLVALRLARAARERGHEVRFVSPTGGDFVALAEREGFRVRVVPVEGALEPGSLRRLTRALRGADVVHTHGHFTVNALGRVAGRLSGARVVSHMHAQNAFRGGRGRAAQVALDNATARLCSAIVAVSRATADTLRRQGYPDARIVTIPNGVDPVEPAEPVRLADGPVILEVGRLDELKGQRTLIEAAAGLDATVVLAGRGDDAYERELRALAGRVVFAGPRDDVPGLLAGCDVFCLPSRAEGMPLVVLEAMAQGKPVVASAVGGIPELVADGETGLLVPPGDVEALRRALGELLADPERARRLGAAGRERVRAHFAGAEAEERVLALYEPGQADVRDWWSRNPMTYDWRGEIEHEAGSPEHLAEVERRFLAEAWFAQEPGAAPFSAFVPFDELAGKDVLEIGCGTGVHARLLAQAGARLSAVDLTPTAVELTRRRLALHGLEADVREADAESLPFADASFDYVWSWGVIHHSQDTRRVVAEIARVLRPGGGLGLMVYNRSSITWWVQYQLIRGVLALQLLRSSPDEIANRYSDGVIARHYTRAGLARLLEPWFEQVETEVVGQRGEAIPLPARLRRPVERVVPAHAREQVVRRFGWFLVARALRRA